MQPFPLRDFRRLRRNPGGRPQTAPDQLVRAAAITHEAPPGSLLHGTDLKAIREWITVSRVERDAGFLGILILRLGIE